MLVPERTRVDLSHVTSKTLYQLKADVGMLNTVKRSFSSLLELAPLRGPTRAKIIHTHINFQFI